MFPNHYNIYLHDTPSQEPLRATGAGLQPRLHPPERSVRLRLRPARAAEADPEGYFRRASCDSGAETRVDLDEPVPVHLDLPHRLHRRRRADEVPPRRLWPRRADLGGAGAATGWRSAGVQAASPEPRRHAGSGHGTYHRGDRGGARRAGPGRRHASGSPARPSRATAGPDATGAGDEPDYAEGLGRGPRAGGDALGRARTGRRSGSRPRFSRRAAALAHGRADAGARPRAGDRARHPPDGASIDPTARTRRGRRVGPFAVIGPRRWIGAGSRIGAAGQRRRRSAEIGAGALLHAGVRIGRKVRIGARVHRCSPTRWSAPTAFPSSRRSSRTWKRARATLGGSGRRSRGRRPGTASTPSAASRSATTWRSAPNTSVDRGTIRATRIGDGTKIDNLVQVGHNVVIGARLPALRAGRHRRLHR